MPNDRLLGASLAAALLVAAHAADVTHLSDEGGTLQLDAPGTWRATGGDYAFAASGFLNGVKRTELFALLYPDLPDAASAAKRWKEARAAAAPAAEFTNPNADPLRFIVVEPGKRTTEYCRALDGAGVSAVVFARVNGDPGTIDADVFAILDLARLEKAADSSGGAGRPAVAMRTVKDRDFALELSVPQAMTERKELDPPQPRVTLSLRGPLGSDPDAILDVYALPDFDRTDAAGYWWMEGERRGWRASGVRIEGEPPSFLVLKNGDTWSRHVRVLPTKAGVYALKLDVESSADKAAAAWLDQLVEGRSLTVLRPRPDSPTPPPNTAKAEGAAHWVLSEADAEATDAISKEAAAADALVARVLGLDALDGRKGTLRIVKDQTALDAALRPLGGPAGRAAWWSIGTREVWCRAGVLASDPLHAEFLLETAREAVRRRFGFRPPFWVEWGVAHLVEGAAFSKGRIDQLNPLLSESAHDSVGVNIEFESVRWWTEEESVANPERQAIAWGLWLMFTEGGNVSQKWADLLKQYLTKLRQTGRPAEATKAFPYDRDSELVEDYKKRMKKLDR